MLTRNLAFISILLICGCADPRPPTGGPRDEQPPILLSTDPPHESVEVSPTELRLNFSEYVNEASLARALSIVPPPQGKLQFKWRKRSVSVRLSEPLRDSTTYVVTLDDEFRDWHGVRLTQPISFAFSTGPVIDQGRLRGRIIDQSQGRPVAGLLVLAYNTPDIISEISAYQTQTDPEGRFEFNYVRESDFFLIGLRDLNRNLKPDHGEWFAVPPIPQITAIPDTNQKILDWIYTKVDTLRPTIERVRATTNQLIEVRFSEGVSISNLTGESWMLSDSLQNTPVKVHSSYQLESNPRMVYLMSDTLQEQTYRLFPDVSVQDSTGNSVRPDPTFFMGNLQMITTEPQFQHFLTANSENPYRLAPWEMPHLVFDQPVHRQLLDSLLSVEDSTGAHVSFDLQSSNGTSFRITSLDDPTQIYRVSIKQKDSTYVRFFERLGAQSLGSISGFAVPKGDSVIVRLTEMDGKILATQSPDSESSFVFENLPEKSYRIHAFIDRNHNGTWDGGLIHPYEPAEPITWFSESITIRPRWDTALAETLMVSPPPSIPSPASDQ